MSGIGETLISAAQAADIRQRANAFHAWVGERTSYREADIPSDVPRVTNAELGKLEQFEVWRDKPARLFAYVKADERNRVGTPYGNACAVTTWNGEPLGYGAFGKLWRDNFGGKRRAVHVRIAGVDYSGTAFVSAGDYCRLRRVKS